MPNLDDAATKDLATQVAGLEMDDFEPTSIACPVDAEDGAPVALLIIGYAKDGKLDSAEKVILDLHEGMEGKEGLKGMLPKKPYEKADGEDEEE